MRNERHLHDLSRLNVTQFLMSICRYELAGRLLQNVQWRRLAAHDQLDYWLTRLILDNRAAEGQELVPCLKNIGETAVQLGAPRVPIHLYQLAEIQHQQGDVVGCRESLQAFLMYDPENDSVQATLRGLREAI